MVVRLSRGWWAVLLALGVTRVWGQEPGSARRGERPGPTVTLSEPLLGDGDVRLVQVPRAPGPARGTPPTTSAPTPPEGPMTPPPSSSGTAPRSPGAAAPAERQPYSRT